MSYRGPVEAEGADMLDITAPEVLEVVIGAGGETVWINGPEKCLFRACQIKRLVVHDNREGGNHEGGQGSGG
jgi:hypothetical protein